MEIERRNTNSMQAFKYKNGAFEVLEPHQHPMGFDCREWTGVPEASGYSSRGEFGVVGGDTTIEILMATTNARLDLWPYRYVLDVTIGSFCELVYAETYPDMLRALQEHHAVLSLALQTQTLTLLTEVYDDWLLKKDEDPHPKKRRQPSEAERLASRQVLQQDKETAQHNRDLFAAHVKAVEASTSA